MTRFDEVIPPHIQELLQSGDEENIILAATIFHDPYLLYCWGYADPEDTTIPFLREWNTVVKTLQKKYEYNTHLHEDYKYLTEKIGLKGGGPRGLLLK